MIDSMSKTLNYKKLKQKITYDKCVTWIFLIILIITLLYNALFQGGSKLSRILLAIGAVIGSRIFFKVTFLKKSNATYIATLIFIMFSMYLGNILNFYTYIPRYDKVLHLISGIIIGIISIVVYAHFTNDCLKKINPKFMVFFSIMFTLALAGGWEIWEFTSDRLFGLQSQLNSLNDTMTDIICGTIGGLISLIPIYRFAKGKKNKFLDAIVKEVID